MDAAQVPLSGVTQSRPASATVASGWQGALRWGLVGLLLVAWGLRLPPLLDSPLHPDEALYGYWGLLIGRGQDPWLAGLSVFKPPLLPYVVAISQLLFGESLLALRLPGLIAGMLAIPLVGALAAALYRDVWTGAGAMTAVALSPFAVASSGSVFPDPLMVAFGAAGCVAAAKGRPRWGGLLAGLSLVTKQTGLVWLPLVLGVALGGGKRPKARLRGFAMAYLMPLLLAIAWDGVRMLLGADSFWSAGFVGYGGLRLIWPHELWPRLRVWVGHLASLFQSPLVNVVLIAGLATLVRRGTVQHCDLRRSYFDLLLVSFCLIYVLLHWLVAFPVWGRYLMPLVAVLSVLLGRIAREIASLLTDALRVGARPLFGAVFLVALLVVPAVEASAGRYEAGEDRAVYENFDDVMTFLRELPEGSVVYHHWLGWHYHYVLFDAPLYLAYWPNPAWLARDVQAFGRQEPRYITFPAWESEARVEQALAEVGYALEPELVVRQDDGRRSFLVYGIVPSPGS